MQETGNRPRPPHLKVFLQQNRLENANINLTITRNAGKLIKVIAVKINVTLRMNY